MQQDGFIMKKLPKILFVDDEQSVLKGIELNLGRKYDVIVANSANDALELIHKGNTFEVAVVDYVMPSMNGADLLKEIRRCDQSMVAILLTGATNYEYASEFVRQGGAFRLLSKPCPPDELIENIDAALLHYNEVVADDHTLGEIMNSVVRSFTSVLAAALPLYFGRSQRVMRMATEIAKKLRLRSIWRIDSACVFSHLGFATLPPDVQLRAYQNEGVKPHELELIGSFGDFTREMLSTIPKMHEVMKVVDLISEDYCDSNDDDKDSAKLASVIRLAKHYDYYASKGQNRPMIFESILKNKSIYYRDALNALSEIRPNANGGPQVISIETNDLKKGMRLQEDLLLENGTLFAPQGSIVNPPLLYVMNNYRVCSMKDPFPQRITVSQGSSFENEP